MQASREVVPPARPRIGSVVAIIEIPGAKRRATTVPPAAETATAQRDPI